MEKGPNVYRQGLREEAAAVNTQAGGGVGDDTQIYTHTGFPPLLLHLGVTPIVSQDPTIL